MIVEGELYALYCPWGTILRTRAVEIVREDEDPNLEMLHAQAQNTMDDTICVDSYDFRIDGTIIYLYDASVHFTRRHAELLFDPYEDVEEMFASEAAAAQGLESTWMDRNPE